MRLFFALWPEAALARSLSAWALEAARATGGRAVAAEKIHLTLAFLGEVPETRLAAARAAAGRCRTSRLSFSLTSNGYWPRNRIVWVGSEETVAPLHALAAALHFELGKENFSLEKRPFAAHLTLVRKADPPKQLPPLPRLEWPVREFVLVRSALSAGGSSYEVLERFALRPSG